MIYPRRNLIVPSRVKQRGFIINPYAFGGSGGGSSVTPIIWNSADKSANISLSEVDKLSTKITDNAWASARSTTSFATGAGGEFMFEVEVVGDAQILVGFMKSTASLTSFTGSDADGWGYYATNGQKFTGGSGSAYGATLAVGDKFRAKINSAGDVEFFKVVAGTPTSQGVAFTGLSGTFFPSVSLFIASSSGGRAT